MADLFQPVEKSLIVIGGANGSGKSTLVKELELKFAFAHLDPDRIVVPGRQSAPGREAIALRSTLFAGDDTFGLETTLSGKAIGRFFRSNVNFWTNYRLIADQWFLFNNGHNNSKLAASGTKNVYDVHSRELFKRYRGVIDECNSEINGPRA